MRSVYSFDVFDTCVTRTFAHPRDLFYELGLRLAPANLTEGKKHAFAARFQAQRIRAEKSAHRNARPRQAVTLDEIYDCFRCPPGLSTNPRDLVQAEIELERESIYAVPAVVSHLNDLRSAGHRIVFISDMYLPAPSLGPILERCGVMKEGDTLYVSCDVGLTKHHGHLFRHVLQAEGLIATQLVHAGDNLNADVRMAANAEIRAVHFRAGMLTRREAAVAGYRLPRVRGKTFLAALSRRARLSTAASIEVSNGPLDHVVHGVIGPLLLAYVAWVLGHAKTNGIHRLYFVARDGEILYRIAQILQGDDPSIELRYLYGSRRAWLPPSIDPRATEWQRLLLIPGQATSMHDMAARMGLDESDEAALRNFLACTTDRWAVPLSHEQARAFLDEILNNQAAAEHVFSLAARKRELAVSYFAQEGLLGDTPWALVDAGWSLNSQAALKRILEVSGVAHRSPRGYYLALARDHLSETQAGAAYPFITRAGSIFSRRRVVVEHCFLPSTHASTRGYRLEKGRICPVFGGEIRGRAELEYARKLHEVAASFARIAHGDNRVLAALAEHKTEILSAAEALLRHPDASDARAMASFGAVADMRHEKSFVTPLCRPLRWADIWTVLGMILSKRKNFESPTFMWLEGSMALSRLDVQLPLMAMLRIDDLRNWVRDRKQAATMRACQ